MNGINTKLNFKDPATWLATWFGCGLARPGPGTVGTLGALPFGILMMMFGGWPVLLAATAIIFLVGLWAAGRVEKQLGEHDASLIVIDEVAGMWLTLMAAAPTPLSVLLALGLFRLFDILKPWPISWADKKLPGAAGVMVDDILAGIYAVIVLEGLSFAGIG